MGFLFALIFHSIVSCHASSYRVGVAKTDITGQIVGQAMMGYGLPEQKTSGIHTRLYARAFVVENTATKSKVVFAVVDQAFVTNEIKQDVLAKLQLKGFRELGFANVLISATHTHSGPGGYLHPPLYNFTTFGFHRHDYNQVIDGVVAAIEQASNALQPAKIRFAEGELAGASVNRSEEAFQANPESKLMSLKIDPQMAQLIFEKENGQVLGVLNWFGIHPTSLSSTNRLISGDNKEIASLLFEQAHPGSVAAFANSVEGDVSPVRPEVQNKQGIELEREQVFSIGKMQYEKSKQILLENSKELAADIEVSSVRINMPGYEVRTQFTGNKNQTLCPSALGLSFVAGADDGRSHIPGYVEGLKQGEASRLPFGFRAAFFIFGESFSKSSQPLLECQFPKPVWLASGSQRPAWTYDFLEFQLIRIGELAIVAVPSELSVMAGLNLKKQLLLELKINQATRDVSHVVIAGLANGYSHYVTTKPEYDLQQYEGASTLFGPYTFAAYQQIFSDMIPSLLPPHKLPQSQVKETKSKPFELPQWLRSFFWSQSKLKLLSQKMVGNTLEAEFETSNPNLDYRLNQGFVELQKKTEQGDWVKIASDIEPLQASVSTSGVVLEWIGSNHLKVQASLFEKGEYRILVSQDFEKSQDKVFSDVCRFEGAL